MAITALCSSPTHSPSIPTLPSLKPHQTIRHHPPISPISSKLGIHLAFNDTLTIAAAAEAVALASGAIAAAREAVLVSVEIENGNGLGVKSRMRRKKRKGFECFDLGLEEIRVSGGNLKSREEEKLCLCLKEGARLEAARRRIAETPEHEPTLKQLARAIGIKKRSVDKIISNERESRERIIRSYRRLVVSIATSYQGKGLSLKDLIQQEGSIGLLRGAEKFNPERGYKLSTYVYWWIKQAITRAIDTKSRIIRLPGSRCEMVAKIAEANNVMSRRLRRLPTHAETAEFLNVPVSTVRLVSARSRPPISLDRPVTDESSLKLQDIIPGPNETIPENMVKKRQMKQDVEKLLSILSKREAHILRLHFGLDGEYPLSCEEIGARLKLSRERIRQINGIALTKLYKKCVADDFKVYIV